ncbi:MAG: helix-turn-helix transcriptional regulator, partial [Gimesia chilikensis]
MASKFSAAVRAGLLLKGVNQSALASKLGVSENTVSRWVQDKCLPDRESILHLKDFFQWEESRLTRLLEDWYENGGGEIGYRVAGPEYVKWRYGGDYLAFLDDIIRLDHETIDDLEPLDVGTSAQWAPVFKSGTECWRLILHRDEIIGYWQFVFLKEKFFAGFLRGELRDSMLTLDML